MFAEAEDRDRIIRSGREYKREVPCRSSQGWWPAPSLPPDPPGLSTVRHITIQTEYRPVRRMRLGRQIGDV